MSQPALHIINNYKHENYRYWARQLVNDCSSWRHPVRKGVWTWGWIIAWPTARTEDNMLHFCMWEWGKKEEHFFIKMYIYIYIRLFILLKGVEASVLCETDGDMDRLRLTHTDPKLLLLTIARYVIFKTHLALLLLGQGCSSGDRWEQQPPARHSHWLKAAFGLHCLQLSQLPRASAYIIS